MRPAFAALPFAEATSTPPETPFLDALSATPRGFSTWIKVSPGPARVTVLRRARVAGTARLLRRAPAKAEPRAAVTLATGARAAMANRRLRSEARAGVAQGGARGCPSPDKRRIGHVSHAQEKKMVSVGAVTKRAPVSWPAHIL